MIEARSRRVRPHLDDKVLASWNGLMLGALARGYGVLGEEFYLSAAEKNVEFIRAHLWVEPSKPEDGVGTLYHRWRDGDRDDVQLLEGYAFLLDGVIGLYQATLNVNHLDFGMRLAESMLAKFFDATNGGFWQSVAGASDLILRTKEDYDGAMPSGNSVATLALLKLGAITGERKYTDAAEQTLRLFAARLAQTPQALPYMLQALDFFVNEPMRVVIAGEAASKAARELIHAAHALYQPNKVVLGTSGNVEPFARTLSGNGESVAYVCTGTACQAPTRDAAGVKKAMGYGG
jgi:uncharacterized protein YyaL (SSP411 family)